MAMDEQPPVDVEVRSPSTWGGTPGHPDFHVVRYPDGTGIYASRIDENTIKNALQTLSDDGFLEEVVEKIGAWLRQPIPGREYIIDNAILERHFELVLPQTFRVQAWGGVFERPFKAQRDLDDELDAERDTLPYGQSIDVPTASEELRAASEELQSTGDSAEPSSERAAADEPVTGE